MGELSTVVAACVASSSLGVLVAICAAPRGTLSIGDRAAGFAVGTLLGAALFELAPRAMERIDGGGEALLLLALAGVGAFVLNRACFCRHPPIGVNATCGRNAAPHRRSTAVDRRMLVAGDLTHSLIDGSLIAAAFATSFTVGAITAIAVALHELPRRIAVVCILARLGLARWRMIGLSLLAVLATIGGGAGGYASAAAMRTLMPALLAVAAFMLIFVAMMQLLNLVRVGNGHALTGRKAGYVSLGVAAVLGAHHVFEAIAASAL